MARKEQSRTLKVCEVCGKEFMGVKCAKVCSPACRKEANRVRDAIERIKQKEQQADRKEMSDLARFNAEARAAGMHYGQYEAWLRSEAERKERLAGKKGATNGKAR